jgi:hypothetical protein
MDEAVAVPILKVGGKSVVFTGSFTHLVSEPVSFRFPGNSNFELYFEFLNDDAEPRITTEPGDKIQNVKVFNLNSGLLQGTSKPTVIGERTNSNLLLHLATMRTGEGSVGLRITFITIFEEPK